MTSLGSIALISFPFKIKAKSSLRFYTAKLRLDCSDCIFNLLVLFTNDGKGLDFSAGLVDQKTEVVAHKIPVVDPNVVTVGCNIGLSDISLVSEDGERRGSVVGRDPTC